MSTGRRLPLADADAIAEDLVEMLEPHTERLLVVGSCRRRRRDVGDVELLAIPKVETEPPPQGDLFGGDSVRVLPLHAEVTRCPYLDPVHPQKPTEPDARWEEKRFAGSTRYWRLRYDCPPLSGLVDLYMCDPEQWGVMAVIRTGPAELSHWLVMEWTTYSGGGHVVEGLMHPPTSEHNYRRLYKGRPLGDPLETPTEEAVFEALGLDYLEPEDRDSWHRLKVEAARRRGV